MLCISSTWNVDLALRHPFVEQIGDTPNEDDIRAIDAAFVQLMDTLREMKSAEVRRYICLGEFPLPPFFWGGGSCSFHTEGVF